MALERNVLMPDGSVRGIHEVERITHICGESTIVDVLSWKDETKAGGSYRTILTHDYDSDLNEQDAYDYFSALPEFAEYVDPAQEAIDALIPTLTDEQAELVPALWHEWAAGVSYAIGDRVSYVDALWRCVQAHTSQEGWEPDKAPALWVRTSADPIPEWVQPTGAHDAYAKGEKVRHIGRVWESDIDANAYEPPTQWTEVTA